MSNHPSKTILSPCCLAPTKPTKIDMSKRICFSCNNIIPVFDVIVTDDRRRERLEGYKNEIRE